MKKVLSMVLSAIIVFSMLTCGGITSSASDLSGSCGDDVTWEYSPEYKTITISGSGYMTNYVYDNGTYNRPWESFKDEIEELVIKDGLASIGDYAFVDCKNLEKFTSRCYTTLEVIGQGAFESCINLRKFFVPSTVVAIGPSAFKGCIKLGLFRLQKDVIYIGDDAFADCPIECTLYTGTPDQASFMYFEDDTESLVNVVYADTRYDISVDVGSYHSLSVVSLQPFSFVIKDESVARDFRSSYKTITENGVVYYYGEMAVMGESIGETSVFAIGDNNEMLGVFSVLVSSCSSRHNYTKKYEAIAPACYQNGVIISECGDCHYKKSELLETTPHTFVYETVTEATCLTEKIEVGTCSVCNKKTQRKGPATGHKTITVSQQAPTCQEPGVEIFKCEVCGKEYEHITPQLDHNWTDWVVTVAPTEETEGERERQCTMCEEKQTEIIPPLSTLMGDVNGDGRVSAIDARWALQCAAQSRELDEHYFKLADINGDGKITTIDARKILQLAATAV